MKVEIPTLKRCCCCLPLRPGLLAWVYVKLAIALTVSAFYIAILVHSNQREFLRFFAFEIMVMCSLLLEISFNIFFLINGHRKNFENLKIYYRYAIVILVIEVLGFVGYICFEIYMFIDHPHIILVLRFLGESTCISLALIVLQTYFILLLRSEIRKLENNAKFQFVNHTATEPQCKALIIA